MTPFDSIESSLEYVRLLAQAVDDAVSEIEEDIRQAELEGGDRRLNALQLVGYKLERLRDHMTASRRLLNDLRTLRRLLLGERRQLLPPSSLPTDQRFLESVATEEP